MIMIEGEVMTPTQYAITVESELSYCGNGKYIAKASGGGEECFYEDYTEGRARNIARANLIALLAANDRNNKAN